MSRRSTHPTHSPSTGVRREASLGRELRPTSAQEEDSRGTGLDQSQLQTQSRSESADGRQSRASGVHAILNPAEPPSVDAPSGIGTAVQRPSQQIPQDTQAGAVLPALHTSTAASSDRYGISSSPSSLTRQEPRRASHPGTLYPTSPPRYQISGPRLSTEFPGQPRSYSFGGVVETPTELDPSLPSQSTSPLTSARARDSQNLSPIEFPSSGRGSTVEKHQLTSYPTPQGPSVPPSRPPGHEYMTIQTEQGPVSVLVDVTAASKAADEKRKRNAGASARFRARRKERESASTKENDDLRQTITNLTEEVDFYRRERDYFASLIYHGPDRDRHFPRPPSPRQRRGSQPAAVPTPLGPGYEERGGRGQEGAYTRRRLTIDQPIESGLPVAPPPQLPRPSYPSTYALPPGPTPSTPSTQQRGSYSSSWPPASGSGYPEPK